MKHAVACQSAIPQVAAIEPDESLYGLFDLSTGSVETASECDISDPAVEVLMVNGPRSPPGFPTPTEGTAEATQLGSTRSINPSHSLRCKEKIFAAGTWMLYILLS